MKRRITLSIALVLSIVLVTLTSSDSKAQAQNQIGVVADTGLITLGPNQILRLTVNTREGNDTINVRFRRQEYIDTGTTAGVRKLAVSSQDLSDLIPLMPGEATSIDFRRCAYPMCSGVYAMVLSDSRNVRVNAMIIDTVTGNTTAVLIALLIP
jgi:hypothetical protein